MGAKFSHDFETTFTLHRLDHQPLFEKGARAPPPKFFSGRPTQTRHVRAAEIEPTARYASPSQG